MRSESGRSISKTLWCDVEKSPAVGFGDGPNIYPRAHGSGLAETLKAYFDSSPWFWLYLALRHRELDRKFKFLFLDKFNGDVVETGRLQSMNGNPLILALAPYTWEVAGHRVWMA